MKNVIWIGVICLMALPISLLGQGKKPEVLVYGQGFVGYAAALQSAKSNLHTIWVIQGDELVPEARNIQIQDTGFYHAGIWAEIYQLTQDSLTTRSFAEALEFRMEGIPHLQIIRQGGIRKASPRKKTIRVQLADRKSFTVRAVVDASPDGELSEKLGLAAPSATAVSPSLRTSVVAAAPGDLPSGNFIGLKELLPQENSNFLSFSGLARVKSLAKAHQQSNPGFLVSIGQALGATAGYLAFFKTTPDKIDLRQIQGELVQYGAKLIPLVDIPHSDPNFQAIQRVAATGLWMEPPTTHFEPSEPVSTNDLEGTMNQLYSRSQIWFQGTHKDTMRLDDLLSLIKYISHRGPELEGLVEKGWTKRFQFEGSFDLAAPVNRRQVAVLLDEYTKPFDVKVDIDGRILR